MFTSDIYTSILRDLMMMIHMLLSISLHTMMLLRLLILIGSLSAKPIVVRNVSDCSITDEGILHYYGRHSFTKFEHECLAWNGLQTNFPDIINEPNFFHDASIKAAKNYCRNPNMNINGPWCFVENDSEIIMEQCEVCQSLARKPTLPTDIGVIEDAGVDKGFFERVRDEMKRYGTYLREKFWEIIERIRNKFKQLG